LKLKTAVPNRKMPEKNVCGAKSDFALTDAVGPNIMLKFLKFVQWSVLTLVFVIVAGLLAAAAVYMHIREDLPEISSVTDYRPPLVTTVYSDDGRKIAEFYRERRIVIPLSQMPKKLAEAFIAAEDSRFFNHKGVDYFGIVRAFLKNIESGAIVQGGSTITQQVVKPFLSKYERSYRRKLKEAILAYRIEKRFTKEEILSLYLNQIYMGSGAYGVEAASEIYFGKSAKELNLAECALLAGLPKAPSEYAPNRYPEKAKIRQKYVLDRMITKGYITARQAAEALNTKIEINKERKNWYREVVPYFAEHVRRYVEEKFGADLLYEGGLQIYTTVNIGMQKTALKTVEQGLRSLEERQKYSSPLKPEAALICIETGTGYVKAMVGGRDFRKSQLNRATQSKRQPGSAFKAIIYAAAIDKGYTPSTIIADSDVTYWNKETRTSWSPANYDKKFYGPIPLRKALAASRNVPAVRTLDHIGIDYAISYARKLGIMSDLDKGLSLALGPSGLSLLELTTAYSVFANLGRLIHPVFITKILDRDGREMQEMKIETRRVIEKNTAYIMTDLLQDVVRKGTARNVSVLNRPVAGKTGTSSDLRDAWFIGYTPDYITGTWVGFDQERSLGEKETGSRAASPIWLDFMQEILADRPVRDFDVPEGIIFVNSECYKQGTEPLRARPPAEEDEFPSEEIAVSSGQFKPALASQPRKVQEPTIKGLDQFFKSTM